MVSRSNNVKPVLRISSSTYLSFSISISQTLSLGVVKIARYLPDGEIENEGSEE